MAYILTETCPDGPAFLNAILDAPADDAPRLVYADWLDERGETNPAAVIRLQVRQARRPADWTPDDAAELNRLAGHDDAEAARRLLPGLVVPEGVTVTFRRGLPECVAVGPGLRDAGALAALCAALPLTTLSCVGAVDITPYLRAAAAARRLARLEIEAAIRGHSTPAEHAAAVAALGAVRLDGLVALEVGNYRVDGDLAGALARPDPLPRLRSLGLTGGLVDADAVAALRAGFRPTGLDVLELMSNGLDDDEAVLMADWPALATVTELNLYGNFIGADGVGALADSPYLNTLRWLDLENNPLGAEGGRRLARGRGLASLVCLKLRGTGAGWAWSPLRKRFRIVQLGPNFWAERRTRAAARARAAG